MGTEICWFENIGFKTAQKLLNKMKLLFGNELLSFYKHHQTHWKKQLFMMKENNVRCNNPKCNRDYLQYVFGGEYQRIVDDIDNIKKYKKNKWYKCKECQITFYCSRRCQK